MAKNDLVGNLATENLVGYFGGISALNLSEENWEKSFKMANEIFHS